MGSEIEVLSGEVEKLNIENQTPGKWLDEVIDKCIDASVWKPLKEVILDDSKPFPVSGIRSVEIAEWAVANGLPLGGRVAKILVRNGVIEVVEYLCSKGLEWSSVVLAAFETEGSIETVRWLHRNGHWMQSGFFSNDLDVCAKAVHYNRVDIFKWAVNEGFKYTWGTRFHACMSNDPVMRDFGNSLPRV